MYKTSLNKFYNSRKITIQEQLELQSLQKKSASFLWALFCLFANFFFVMLCSESYVIFYRQSGFDHALKCFYLSATRSDAFLANMPPKSVDFLIPQWYGEPVHIIVFSHLQSFQNCYCRICCFCCMPVILS